MFEVRLNVVVDLSQDIPPLAPLSNPLNLHEYSCKFAHQVCELMRASPRRHGLFSSDVGDGGAQHHVNQVAHIVFTCDRPTSEPSLPFVKAADCGRYGINNPLDRQNESLAACFLKNLRPVVCTNENLQLRPIKRRGTVP